MSMYTQEIILKELIESGSPYAVQFHRVLAKKYGTSVHKVGAVAQRYSLAIDAALDREKAAKETPMPKIPGRPRWKQAEARAILAQKRAQRQFEKETNDMQKALATVDAITPELLARVGIGK